MAPTDTRQRPFFDVRRFLPQPYPTGSFYEVLEQLGRIVVRASDFPDTDPRHGGADSYCPVLLSKLVLLQRHHQWTDRETVHPARCDMAVKAGQGLSGVGIGASRPSQSTLCRHRSKMQLRQLDQLYMERMVKRLKTLDLVQTDEAVAVDSMPIEGAGQVLDTYNLLAAGIRQALRRLAQRTAESTQAVAKRLGLLVYLERSIKGQAGVTVQWESEAGRKVLLEKLVQDALRVQQEIPQVLGTAPPKTCQPEPTEPDPELSPSGASGAAPPQLETPPMRPATPETTPLHQAAVQLSQILAHDVEMSADGKVKGNRQVPAGDRLISITDPDMRHGRKSKSVIIAGYKVSVMASLLFGFILLTRVMRANLPDGQYQSPPGFYPAG